MKKLYIAPFPAGLTQSANPEQQKKQGEEPHAAAPEGVRLSTAWRLFADDREVPVFATPVTRGGPHSFAQVRLEGDEPVHFRAVRNEKIESVEILPASYGLTARHTGAEAAFDMKGPGHATLLVNGGIDQPLTVSVKPLRPVKAPREIKGRYFGPGVHPIDVFDFEDGDTLYVDDGAVVVAQPHAPEEKAVTEKDWAGQRCYRVCIRAEGKRRISIEGGGILDFSLLNWHERSPIVLRDCQDVLVRDVTLVNAPAWNLNLCGCEQAEVDSVSIFGYRENSDGIDIVSSEHVRVHDCFLRTGDDAVVVKAMLPPPRCGGRDIDCRRCVVWNDKVRCFGIAAESRNDISDVYFGDCDVIRSYADWTLELGALVVYICDRALVSRVTFEDIRIEHECHLATHVMITQDFWSKDPEAGNIRDVTFRRISVKPRVGSRVAGYRPGHTVEGVRYEDFRVGGKRAATLEEAGVQVGDYTRDITLR